MDTRPQQVQWVVKVVITDGHFYLPWAFVLVYMGQHTHFGVGPAGMNHILFTNSGYAFITSMAKEVMFLVALVCLSVCLFVCLSVDITQIVVNGLG